MSNKKQKRPTGPSFPFMESNEKTIKLKYDLLKVEKKDGQISIIFHLGDTPIYAYTYEVGDNDFNVDFDGLCGEVQIEINN